MSSIKIKTDTAPSPGKDTSRCGTRIFLAIIDIRYLKQSQTAFDSTHVTRRPGPGNNIDRGSASSERTARGVPGPRKRGEATRHQAEMMGEDHCNSPRRIEQNHHHRHHSLLHSGFQVLQTLCKCAQRTQARRSCINRERKEERKGAANADDEKQRMQVVEAQGSPHTRFSASACGGACAGASSARRRGRPACGGP
jgi:hypothetical protein